MVVLLRWLSSCMRRKKPKRPRNKGQEEKEEEAERVLMSFNSSQRVWCKRLLKTTTAAAGMAAAMAAAAWCGGGRRCCFASFLCDLFCFTEGQKLKTMKTTPLLVAVSCKALPMAEATESCPPAFAHTALLLYSAAAR